MNVLFIIVGIILIVISTKLFVWSQAFKKDADDWRGIKDSDIGTTSHSNYVFTFVLGIIFAGAGVYIMTLVL